MDLVRQFPATELERALEDWHWLPGVVGKEPLATSPFGDVFLAGPDGVWFLSMLEGQVTREWDDVPQLREVLATEEGQDRFLLGPLAEAAHRNGLQPREHELLDWTVPPILGAPIEPTNISVRDMVVVISLAGQIHQQVRDLPAGTRIGGVTVDGEQPTKQRRRGFWRRPSQG